MLDLLVAVDVPLLEMLLLLVVFPPVIEPVICSLEDVPVAISLIEDAVVVPPPRVPAAAILVDDTPLVPITLPLPIAALLLPPELGVPDAAAVGMLVAASLPTDCRILDND